MNTPTHTKSPKCIPRLGHASRPRATPLVHLELTSVGQPSADNEISKLNSVLTTDARSRFGAEMKATDAS